MSKKQVSAAPIIFLLGTSTAGKSTICKKVLELNQGLPFEQQKSWTVWGTDMEMAALRVSAGKSPICDFKENRDFTYDELYQSMLSRSIDSSRSGMPTLLDVSNPQLIDLLQQQLVISNHQCPLHVLLVHVPIDELIERMERRNQESLQAGEDTSNLRASTWPLHQYSRLFTASNGQGIAQLQRDTVHSAVATFGEDSREQLFGHVGKKLYEAENQTEAAIIAAKEARELLKKIGFVDYEESVGIKQVLESARLRNHYDMASTMEIAQEILQLGANSQNSSPSSTISSIRSVRRSQGRECRSF